MAKLHEKTLREVMGLMDHIDDIKLGDTVQIINSGHIGKVEQIGKHGLLKISGAFGIYARWEVEKVDKKNNGLKAANNYQPHCTIGAMGCQGG